MGERGLDGRIVFVAKRPSLLGFWVLCEIRHRDEFGDQDPARWQIHGPQRQVEFGDTGKGFDLVARFSVAQYQWIDGSNSIVSAKTPGEPTQEPNNNGATCLPVSATI
jgi:hypothetical protein